MNLKAIKEVLDTDMPEEFQAAQIIKILAADEKAIPMILQILNHERAEKKELILNMNAELSRADVFIEAQAEETIVKVGNAGKQYILNEISEFYKKYSSLISHCYKQKEA